MKDISLTSVACRNRNFYPSIWLLGGYLKFPIPVAQVGRDDLSVLYTDSYCRVPLSDREVKEVSWSLSKNQANSGILLPLCHCTDIFSIIGAADQLRDT